MAVFGAMTHLEFGGLLDRQVGGLGALEDVIDVHGGTGLAWSKSYLSLLQSQATTFRARRLPRFSGRPSAGLPENRALLKRLCGFAGSCAWLAGLARRRGDRLQRLVRLGRPQIRAADDVRYRDDAQ